MGYYIFEVIVKSMDGDRKQETMVKGRLGRTI